MEIASAPKSRLVSALMVISAAALLLFSLPLYRWSIDLTWHDQQRIGEIAIFLLAAVLAVAGFLTGLFSGARLPRRIVLYLVAAILIGGAASAISAEQPGWAWAEISLFVGCAGLAAVVAAIRTVWPRGLDRGLLALLFLIVAAQIAGFGAACASALMADEIRLDAWLLIDGFSNPRFYGQFLTLALPLLLVPVLSTGELRRYAAVASAITALAWMLAISSGTRGTWLGLGVATAFLPWLGGTGRRWAIGQLLAAGVGLFLFWVLLSLLPGVIGAEVGHHAGTRLTTSLSGRGPLWMMTIDLVLEHPWLGVGPMHFANVPNYIAAHPHQGLLQWAAEWGAPSALAVTALVLLGGWKVMRTIRQHPASTGEMDVIRLCLLASVLASLVQAMVDGVLVMPYTQLWLTLCIGWLIGLHHQVPPAQTLKVGARPHPEDAAATVDARMTRCVIGGGVALFLTASVYLGHVAVRDIPSLQTNEQWFAQTVGGLNKPRFWIQGFIERDAAAWMRVKKGN